MSSGYLTALRTTPIPVLREIVGSDPIWAVKLDGIEGRVDQIAIHLAVFVEPYLSYVLDGRKTVESRFSKVKSAPFRSVNEGDIVLFKRSSGPVVAIGEVSSASFYDLQPEVLKEMQRCFSTAICSDVDPEFWADRQTKSYATLLTFADIRQTRPTQIDKKDRRGWVLVRDAVSRPPVIVFSGPIGSGKTTISQALAEATGIPRVSFGSLIRSRAERDGASSDRVSLQQLGAKLVHRDPEQLCAEVLAQAANGKIKGIIIDGVRHTTILATLCRLLAPLQPVLVFVERKEVTAPLFKFGTDDPSMIVAIQQHSTEAELERLRVAAELTISKKASVDGAVKKIIRYLKAGHK